MSKFYRLFLIVCAFLILAANQAAAQTEQQDSQPAAVSSLNGVRLPAGALRVNDESVPAEITASLGELITLGQGKLRQGESEVLLWTGGNYRQANAAQIIKKLAQNLQNGGWTYAVSEQNKEFTVFNSLHAGERRGVVGLWTASDESLVLAWTEMLSANSPETPQTAVNNIKSSITKANPANSLRVGAETDYVNVMGGETPAIPQFSAVPKKAGYIRGYVKNSLGQPLAGAKLGLKSARIYDGYLAASGETDSKGYYEIKIPTGGARFDYAGYTMAYGNGRAALGLHPADGILSESYPAATGAVENFVLLPFGIADANGVSSNARYRGNYYGGIMLLRYFIAPPGQDPNDFGRMLAANSEIVITLKPIAGSNAQAQTARAFEIRKQVENSSIGEFYICNVPVGRYEIQVKQTDGKPLRLKQKSPTNSVFGIQPKETADSAQLIFNPLSADAKTAAASRGNWTDLEIIVERP